MAYLYGPNGQWIHSRDEIENYFVDQFNELFHSSQPQIPHELDDLFSVCISNEENVQIARVPDLEEIKAVI